MLVHHVQTHHGGDRRVAATSLAIILFWPRLTKRIPGSIVALLAAPRLLRAFTWVETIGTKFGGIPQGFPLCHSAIPAPIFSRCCRRPSR